jgi:hypothetical protein
MTLLRTKVRWTIPGAGTALSILHWSNADQSGATQAQADDAAAKTHAFLTPLLPIIPNVVNVQALNEVEEINEASGDLIGFYGTPANADRPGTAGAGLGWSAPSGAVISWSTAGVRNGRRIRGRTFVVPLSTSVYDAAGTLTPIALTALGNAATALRTGSDVTQFRVWCRPSAPAATDGQSAVVLSHRIPDMAAILRSRRS